MLGLITPHLFSITGAPSPNIGDEIIYNYLARELKETFPTEEFYNFPLHDELNKYHKFLLVKSDIIFVLGSNFITPTLPNQRKALTSVYRMGIVNKLVFMGAGWSGGDDNELSKDTIKFYQTLMNKEYPQSVRDSQSLMKLSVVSRPIVNTSCPTMWSLPSKKYNRKRLAPECLLTLSDYAINIDEDQEVLRLLISKFDRLTFFPQGRYDFGYLSSLDVYKANQGKFFVLERSVKALNEFIAGSDCTYVGTRLHCGIHVLNQGKEALILEVDNRARAISEDTNLPVCKRKDTVFIEKWLEGKDMFETFYLPKSWNVWKTSFKA